MVNFPTQIPDCCSHIPALLDLFISSDPSIFSTMTFLPLGNSHQVVVSVSIDFSSYSQRDVPFHRIAYGYSRADWDSLDVPWEDIFKLSASTAASKVCEWVGINVYIPHRKYRASLISIVFSRLSTVIVHRNHVFHLYQKDKSSESIGKFRQASSRFKRALEAGKLAYANKTKQSIVSQKHCSRDFL